MSMRRIIRMNQVPEKLGVSRSSIYRLIAGNEFVQKIQLSSRCVGFFEDDLNKWLEERAKNTEEK